MGELYLINKLIEICNEMGDLNMEKTIIQSKKIMVEENSIRIIDLEVPGKEVADFFRDMQADEREQEFIAAVELGVSCLQRTQVGRDIDFVKRQLDLLLHNVDEKVKTIPQETQTALIAKLGTGEGQVLAPVQTLINNASNILQDRIKDVRELLEHEMDPAKETTTLGKALKKLRDLFDSERSDSVQGVINTAIKSVTAHDGQLAETVKTVVSEAIKPLSSEVDRLAKEIHTKEAVAEVLAGTPVKGITYEHELVAKLQTWASIAGAEVLHVGIDNQPGDILVTLNERGLSGSPLTIIIEARDRTTPVGRKVISDDLEEAIYQRKAKAGIYVSKTQNGLVKEIGDWAEGECKNGHYVACIDNHIITALRFLIVWERFEALRAVKPELDAAAIGAQIQHIRTAIGRVKTINRKTNDIRNTITSIQLEAETLRDDVKSALLVIEDALRTVVVEEQEDD
jgi:hypothetical protein